MPPRCTNPDCDKYASFNFKSEKTPIYCKTHCFPDAIMFLFQKKNSLYKDYDKSNNEDSYYAGQPKAKNFDNLMENNECKAYLVKVDGVKYTMKGQCKKRVITSKRFEKTPPIYEYKIDTNSTNDIHTNTADFVEDTKEKYRKAFMKANNLVKISGNFGHGIILVRKI